MNIAILLANTARQAPDALAGLCAVPMNAKLHAREFVYMLDEAQARVCLATPGLFEDIEAQMSDPASEHGGAAALRPGLHRVDARLLAAIDLKVLKNELRRQATIIAE